ncbi:MAG: hypothetical protein IJU55_01475 [Selenomonadaceae bacterium]|nr:hypothetical protein [Selenomonadaceae bacterium]
MSKAYEMISESLNEIIEDLEKNGGTNLKREILSLEVKDKKIPEKNFYSDEKYFESATNFQ